MNSPGHSVAAPPPKESQTDVVLNGIKVMIMTGELRPGSRLPIEKELAIQLGVSRGSLREGVRALCIMGVLETRQGDGTYVTSLDSDLLLAPLGLLVDLQTPETRSHLHAVRRVLETESAARAALRITDQATNNAQAILDAVESDVLAGQADPNGFVDADIAFHRLIAQASGNTALAALIEALASRTARTRVWIALHSEGQVRRSHAEHRDILAALRRRDPDRARLLMDFHLLHVEDFVNEQPAATQLPTTDDQ